ncbi:MAG: aminopeptidase N C-terminal domain-containing protein [Planctomycetota bacterium]
MSAPSPWSARRGLERIAAVEDLSKDVFEIVSRALA